MEHVRIQSNVTVQVTDGLDCVDLTVKDSDIKDRIKVKPTWRRCLIKQGGGIYPKEVATWKTVKALEADKVLTIGTETDEPLTSEVLDLAAKKAPKAEPVQQEEPHRRTRKVKVVEDLNSIAGE